MGCFVCTVSYKGMNLWKLFYYSVVKIVKRNAVMHIAGGNLYIENYTVNIANSMRLVCQLLLVVALYEQTTVRIGRADGNSFLLCFLLAFL